MDNTCQWSLGKIEWQRTNLHLVHRFFPAGTVFSGSTHWQSSLEELSHGQTRCNHF